MVTDLNAQVLALLAVLAVVVLWSATAEVRDALATFLDGRRTRRDHRPWTDTELRFVLIDE